MADTTPNKSVAEILSDYNLGTTSDNIDRVFQSSPIGAIGSAIGNAYYGINHRQTPGAIQINKDFFGLTFFTRPKMNMTSENLRTFRMFSPLLSTDSDSVQRIIRCMFDVELGRKGITSQFLDNSQAFIPVLTNTLTSMTAWPDMISPTFTSEPGMYQEAFGFTNGVSINYSTYDISASFRNIPGDPITLMFLMWCLYKSAVYEGIMVPYPDMIIKNEIDYNTRIYRLVLDSSKTFVKKIAACGAAEPLSSPIGASFNFEHDRPINAATSTDQLTIPFRCYGAIYQDPILVSEFNKTVTYFNDLMSDQYRHLIYTKIPMAALEIFNNRGYPRINPDSYELEWWIETELLQQTLPDLFTSP